MSFRRRITLASALAVAVAVLLASVLVYVLTSNQLHSQVDTQLKNRARGYSVLATLIAASPKALTDKARGGSLSLPGGLTLGPPGLGPLPRRSSQAADALTARARELIGRLSPAPGQVRGYQQIVDSAGRALSAPGGLQLPIGAATARLAAKGGAPFYTTVRVKGLHLRVLAEPFGHGHAVQLAQPLTDVDSLLARLRLILALLDVGGIALAALLGRLVAGAAMAPLRQLTEATEHIGLTRDLTRRVGQTGGDELGRLAQSFNAMLDALEHSMRALDASVDAQRQLVADASHELRTPITSLRTNIEILQEQDEHMAPLERRRLLVDVVDQVEVLTALIGDLIELARGEEPRLDAEDVRLDLLVAEVAQRAGGLHRESGIELDLDPTVITGVPERLERAVGNLIDNAIKYAPSGSPVEVSLRDGELCVRDHGPGIAAEDASHVFDRFYRGAGARGRPGSGLGLAIVRQVADQHGATVSAQEAPGGGALLRLRLPAGAVATPAETGNPVDAKPPARA